MTRYIIVVFAVVAVALAGCKGRENADTGGASETIAPAQPQPGATGTDAMTQTVDIEDSRSEAEGAALKLRAVGLDPDRFRVGAYGSDAAERPRLPAIAAQRAAAGELLMHLNVPGGILTGGSTPPSRDGFARPGQNPGKHQREYLTAQFAIDRPAPD